MRPDARIGELVGTKYRIVRKLGDGGMSSVYEARHVKLNRQVAVKCLLTSLMENEEARVRFEREVELLAGLRHPCIVELLDLDALPDGTPCMVLELLPGADLGVWLTRGPLAWDAIARIGDQVMSALALAHYHGIIHRDLKPENIFVSLDDTGAHRVKLLDFGISKMAGVAALTGVFAMLGTPPYMSPEQAAGEHDAIGPPTDVWAVGALLYQMATGVLAFRGDTVAATIMRVTHGSPDPMGGYRQDVPPAFVDLVDHALSRDPARRIMTIDQLRAGLRAALDPHHIHRFITPAVGTPIAPHRAAAPRRQHHRGLWIGGTVAVTLAIGAIAIALVS